MRSYVPSILLWQVFVLWDCLVGGEVPLNGAMDLSAFGSPRKRDLGRSDAGRVDSVDLASGFISQGEAAATTTPAVFLEHRKERGKKF